MRRGYSDAPEANAAAAVDLPSMYLENAVLYTFSTIPQTLGAAFAVLAAFVLYRFQADAPQEKDLHQMQR
jgi:hypothetical protein